MSAIPFRLPRDEECDALTELCRRSKASWGYEAAFIAACTPALRITPDILRQEWVQIAVALHGPVGLVSLSGAPPEMVLERLFVAPDAQGQGLGRRLFAWAVATAQMKSATSLRIVSDPGAEGFYRHLGAYPIGSAPSEARSGLDLPVLRFDLSQGATVR